MTDDAAASPRFATTRWSVVVAAGRGDTAAHEALATLCTTYWYPLYAYARRRGASPEDAQDLVQGFFADLLEKDEVAAVDRERGRFRGFLLAAFRGHWGHEREKAAAQKRGGDRRRVPFETAEGERLYAAEPADDRTPEALYERRWATTLLARVLHRLRAEHAGDPVRFEAFLPFVGGPGAASPYADVAARLGTSEDAVKVAVHRLRRRYRDVLRAEIAETVRDEADVDDEIRRLFDAVAS